MPEHIKDPVYIHETVLRDIMDLYDDVKDCKSIDDLKVAKGPMGRGARSIASAASNYTLIFPVICSRGISIESAAMITKAIEKNAVTMLQRLFAAYQVVQAKDGNVSLDSYLKQFHKNISTKTMSLGDVFDVVDRFSESTSVTSYDKSVIKEDMKHTTHMLPDPISAYSLNRFSISNGIIREAAVPTDQELRRRTLENRERAAADDAETSSLRRQAQQRRNDRDDDNEERNRELHTFNILRADSDLELTNARLASERDRNTRDSELHARRLRNADADHDLTQLRIDNERQRGQRDELAASMKTANDMASYNKSTSEYFKNQVLNTDYKKANELMPTLMTVNFRVETDAGNVVDINSALVGVKAKLYPASSEDIVKHVADKTNSRNWITNFFRATTREISFLKDFVFAIDKAKIDALSLSERNGTSDKMWKVLERRATLSRIRRAMAQNNDMGAITTLCVSQEEVEYLRKYESIDLEKLSIVNGLFASYNLMCVCIVDESLEVAKFIYDEADPMWETISFTHLEREASDNSYKKVVNLMTKMQR